ncbi:MAG: hypothetical protein P1U47_16350 [Zhongshania sp.]|uniref:hypothetical protein n=1 Tax=Zhongshania sp. TaxID=1971902 RepID=UPI002603C5C7|nr:hypothetical protein [Zhongshania sp.]MDF1693948.1 hypothetical protein [Zhongshania sp.]
MTATKIKRTLLGIACATGMAAMPFAASAQISGVALPIDNLTVLLGSSGGLNGLSSLGGGLGDLGGLTGGLDGLGQITTVLGGATGAIGVEIPDFGYGLLDGGLATLSALGLDILQEILGGGGISAIPLLGGDITAFLTPDGLVTGLTELASSQTLPIAIPVVGPHPLKLYAPVVLAILDTQGLPVGNIPLPF